MNDNLRAKLEARLRYFEDLGIRDFYRDRSPSSPPGPEQNLRSFNNAASPRRGDTARVAPGGIHPEAAASGRGSPAKPASQLTQQLPIIPAPSLFEAAERVEGDTLERIREDIGDCTRCKLHQQRTNIVFGVGNPRAELVFIGEGPGHDEDVQGIPFVGRAGKLLTDIIEKGMGLRRDDVYICNVIKCRPPENRLPEKDEIATCSPFLLRQLAAIQPKVIVCLGACAAQTLLGTNRAISHFRGEWFDYRGSRLIATYHPAYLLRNPNAKGEVWKDLQKVMAVLGLKPAMRKRV